MKTVSQVFDGLIGHARCPAQWRGRRLAVLWKKKEDSTICSNSRGILIGDHCGKPWTALLASHVSCRVDSNLPQEQRGCTHGRGTSRASHLTKAFLQSSWLNLSKAFDKVVRETLFGIRSGEITKETHLLGLGLSQAAAEHMAACHTTLHNETKCPKHSKTIVLPPNFFLCLTFFRRLSNVRIGITNVQEQALLCPNTRPLHVHDEVNTKDSTTTARDHNTNRSNKVGAPS